ncbi:MAG TPA: hypothetical protein VF744_17460, partial [Beijerinckiaceae bacterium]
MLPRDFVLLLVVCLVWASNFVVSKLAVSALSVPPLFFSAARLGVVLLCVLPLALSDAAPALAHGRDRSPDGSRQLRADE